MATTEDSMLRFSCPRCFIHLKAKREAAGSRCLCPRCQNFFEVPAKSRNDAPGEDYSLRQSGLPSSVEAVHVLVVCPVCHTRLYGTSDRVGERIECPDCGTPSVVPEPTPVEKKRYRSAEEIGDYGLSSEADRKSGKVAAADGHYVAVVCPVCQTRMHATVDQVGERMICPDCGSTAIVPVPPPAPIIHDPMEGAGEGYGVTQREPAAPLVLPPTRKKAADEDVEEDDSEEKPSDERPEMPSLPFYSRTFTFPFGESARFYTVLLSAWAAMCFWLAYGSVLMTAVAEGKSMFGGAIFGAIALLVSLMWFGYASTCALTVVRDTANGADEVQDWPDAVFSRLGRACVFHLQRAGHQHCARRVAGWVYARRQPFRRGSRFNRRVLFVSAGFAVDARKELGVCRFFAGGVEDVFYVR